MGKIASLLEEIRDTLAEESEDAAAVRELKLFIDNDGELYRQQTKPIILNLMRKRKSGKYDRDLSVKLFMYLVDAGAKKYAKGDSTPWNKMFPKPVRLAVAEQMADEFKDEAESGNYDNMK